MSDDVLIAIWGKDGPLVAAGVNDSGELHLVNLRQVRHAA
jgi:hypothetical protein